MDHIAIYGSDEFCTGFRLAGITKIKETQDDEKSEIKELLQDKEIGILVIEGDLFSRLPEQRQEMLEKMDKPIVVVLSEKTEQENLRKMIKQSIGVDLWEKK